MTRAQLDLLEGIPAPSNGVETSNEAAESIQPDTSRLRRIVFNLIVDRGGLTCDQVEEITGLKHQTASARVYELHTTSQIVDSGQRRKTRSKRNAIVWMVAEKKTEESPK